MCRLDFFMSQIFNKTNVKTQKTPNVAVTSSNFESSSGRKITKLTPTFQVSAPHSLRRSQTVSTFQKMVSSYDEKS